MFQINLSRYSGLGQQESTHRPMNRKASTTKRHNVNVTACTTRGDIDIVMYHKMA